MRNKNEIYKVIKYQIKYNKIHNVQLECEIELNTIKNKISTKNRRVKYMINNNKIRKTFA